MSASPAPEPIQPPTTGPGTGSERLWRDLVGDQLKTVRRERGETLRGVGVKAGVSPQYLSEIERGRKEPSSEILAALGAALDTTLLDLTMGVASRLEQAASTSVPSRGDVRLAA